MFEDDEIDSEFIGVTQRFQNHKENQAIREEVAGLRADIKRKEDKERAAPKCPYCAGTIVKDVSKCRHCASDIKWCTFKRKSYPLKADADVEQFLAQKKQAEERLQNDLRRRDEVLQKRAQIADLEPENLFDEWKVLIGGPFLVGACLYTALTAKNVIMVGVGIFFTLFFLIGMLVSFGDWKDGRKRNKRREMQKRLLEKRRGRTENITINCPICGREVANITPLPSEQVIQCVHCSEIFAVPATLV